MESLLIKLLAFIVAIGILVTVHEYGHFWVARRLGVKVLRFSIGFGAPLWRWGGGKDGTEYVVAAVPLGGYVKMLDEREGEVAAGERHRAFNRQSLPVRSAIVAAGPVFNFLFAIVAFWLVLVAGESGMRATIGEVVPGTAAAEAGFQPGDQIIEINDKSAPTWSQAFYQLAAASMSDDPIRFLVRDSASAKQVRVLPAGSIGDMAEQDEPLRQLGFLPERPELPAVIGEVVYGEAASRAGLLAGDRILAVSGEPIANWSEWVAYIRAHPGRVLDVELLRDGEEQRVELIPATVETSGESVGRIGAAPRAPEGFYERYLVEYRLGPLQAVPAAFQKTWEFSVLTVKVLGRILIGEASIKNLSGPITLADTAGKTASVGWVAFAKFLAIVSVSLGVLNLLPVPVLDGGHLLFFLLEGVRRRPVPESVLEQGQRIGIALLLALMAIAFYVDISRLLG